MPKDDNTTGIKSISKSARNKGAREAKRARLGLIVGSTHGGICSGCGQTATSCTPGTTHEACQGFYLGSFQDELLDAWQEQALSGPEPGEQGATRLHFDGTLVESDVRGRWLSQSQITEKRNQAKTQWTLQQQQRVVLTSGFDQTGKFLGISVTNGLGDLLEWREGAWQPIEVAEVSQILPEVPAEA